DDASGSVASRRIEIWQSGTPIDEVINARRVYDDNGQLIAAEWTKRDGSRSVYSDGYTRAETVADSAETILMEKSAWRLDPSAIAFSALASKSREANVYEEPSAYVVSYEWPGRTGLVRATLKLEKNTLRAVEQRLVVQRGGSNIEYRFTEVGFE